MTARAATGGSARARAFLYPAWRRENLCKRFQCIQAGGRASRAGAQALLGPPGFFWALLGPPGLSWALLGSPGPSWALLGSPGPSWAACAPARPARPPASMLTNCLHKFSLHQAGHMTARAATGGSARARAFMCPARRRENFCKRFQCIQAGGRAGRAGAQAAGGSDRAPAGPCAEAGGGSACVPGNENK